MASSAPVLTDDLILPFQLANSGVSGRLIRLGSSVNTILAGHDYPEAVAQVLGEALALTGLLGASLKFNGRLILQTKTDGPVGFVVTNYESEAASGDSKAGRLRGHTSFDAARLPEGSAGQGPGGQSLLLGTGYLAMTIDPGGDMERYQGIVALEGGTLTEAAETYFRQSEQLPTFVRLAVARHYVGGSDKDASKGWRWRAGGLMLQHVSPEGGHARPPSAREEAEGLLAGEDDDAWNRAQILGATVEAHELLDPLLTPEHLLYRLFNEEGVRVYPPRPVQSYCRCSAERLSSVLKTFKAAELADMKETDGAVAVTCEFCNATYRFSDADLR
jgi:molecular chaperone Hsp33